MKKLFALISAALIFAGCSNGTGSNDIAKLVLFNNSNAKKELKIRVVPHTVQEENSRMLMPVDSENDYLSYIGMVSGWNLTLTEAEIEEGETPETLVFENLTADASGIVTVKTEKTGIYTPKLAGSYTVDDVTYNFYGSSKTLINLQNPEPVTVGVGFKNKGSKGSFTADITFDTTYWTLLAEYDFLENKDNLFTAALISMDEEVTDEINVNWTAESSEDKLKVALSAEEVPSDYYKLKLVYNGSLLNSSDMEVLFDKGSLVVIGDSLKTSAELEALYNAPVTDIVEEYYAANDPDLVGNGLYPQTKGYSWKIIENIVKNVKPGTNPVINCDDFVFDIVKYKNLEELAAENTSEYVITIKYVNNGTCLIKKSASGFALDVKEGLKVSAKDFDTAEGTETPELMINEFTTSSRALKVFFEDFVALKIAHTNIDKNISDKNKFNVYIKNVTEFNMEKPFFSFMFEADENHTSNNLKEKNIIVYVERNDIYQYTDSYVVKKEADADATDIPDYIKANNGDDYEDYYLVSKPLIYLEPDSLERYYIAANSHYGKYTAASDRSIASNLFYEADALPDFRLYTDRECSVELNAADVESIKWYLNNSLVEPSENPAVFKLNEKNLYNTESPNLLTCNVKDSTGSTWISEYRFRFLASPENRAWIIPQKSSSGYNILYGYNVSSDYLYNINQDRGDIIWNLENSMVIVEPSYKAYYQTAAGTLVDANVDFSVLGMDRRIANFKYDAVTGKIWILSYSYEDYMNTYYLGVYNDINDRNSYSEMRIDTFPFSNPYDSISINFGVCNDTAYVIWLARTYDDSYNVLDCKYCLNMYGLTGNSVTYIGTKENVIPYTYEKNGETVEYFSNPSIADVAATKSGDNVRITVITEQNSEGLLCYGFNDGQQVTFDSYGAISYFDVDAERNIISGTNYIGYGKLDGITDSYVEKAIDYSSYSEINKNYTVTFNTSSNDAEDVSLLGKSRILAIKEDEIVLSDVGYAVFTNRSGKKALKKKSRITKFNFTSLDIVRDGINFDFSLTTSNSPWFDTEE